MTWAEFFHIDFVENFCKCILSIFGTIFLCVIFIYALIFVGFILYQAITGGLVK